MNQIWRTSGISNARGASSEPRNAPVGAEVNQTWRTSEQSNVLGVSWEPPYKSVGADLVSGFGESSRPESAGVQYDEDKKRFPQSRMVARFRTCVYWTRFGPKFSGSYKKGV